MCILTWVLLPASYVIVPDPIPCPSITREKNEGIRCDNLIKAWSNSKMKDFMPFLSETLAFFTATFLWFLWWNKTLHLTLQQESLSSWYLAQHPIWNWLRQWRRLISSWIWNGLIYISNDITEDLVLHWFVFWRVSLPVRLPKWYPEHLNIFIHGNKVRSIQHPCRTWSSKREKGSFSINSRKLLLCTGSD